MNLSKKNWKKISLRSTKFCTISSAICPLKNPPNLPNHSSWKSENAIVIFFKLYIYTWLLSLSALYPYITKLMWIMAKYYDLKTDDIKGQCVGSPGRTTILGRPRDSWAPVQGGWAQYRPCPKPRTQPPAPRIPHPNPRPSHDWLPCISKCLLLTFISFYTINTSE